MDDWIFNSNEIDQSVNRESAGAKEQQSGADPEGRLAGEIDIILTLEHFQKIIDTGSYDHEAVEAIIHRLENLEFLQQENVYDKNQWKGYQTIQKDPFGFGVSDNCPKDIDIKTELYHRPQAAH